MSFLEKIVNDLMTSDTSLEKCLVVTPNARASLFVRQHILQHPDAKKPIWMPRIQSIQEFLTSVSQLDLADNFSLIFRLYRHYQAAFAKPRSFDSYYQWGQIVLSDFNEIDLYLVDRKELFRHLHNITGIEEQFAVDQTGPVFQGFLEFASNLEALYHAFTEDLMHSGQATSGMVLRHLAENFNAGLYTKWEKIVFAGFNALSKAEEKLISQLMALGNTDVYWDMDSYFVNDEKQEAGYFFRNTTLADGDTAIKWIDDDILTDEKRVELVGVAGRVAQAKVLGHMLEQVPIDTENTAVILPDESLLFPVLHSLPASLGKVNVTMGYPLKNTSLYHLVHALMDLQLNKLPDAETCFYFKDVKQILLHPYVLRFEAKLIHESIRAAQKNNQVLMSAADLAFIHPAVSVIFKSVNDPSDIIDWMRAILNALVNDMREESVLAPEIEMIFQIYTRIHRLSDVLAEYDVDLEAGTFWKLFMDILESETMPFLGEPLEGLQIMGLLETRALDFRHVYLLSANEGVLPASESRNSFIPNELRQQMNMVTHEHEDAIFAYYFYRLLKGAEEIHILYNTADDAMGKGEKSRFIDQMLFELCDKNPGITLTHRQIQLENRYDTVKSIEIRKTEEMLEELKTMSYSPTRLQTFISCSLKFCFRYVLKLSEQESVQESADARIFGSILHKVMDRLYEPQLKRPLTQSRLIEMKSRVQKLVDMTYAEEMGNALIDMGRNYLHRVVIEALIQNCLDAETLHRTVVETEAKLSSVIEIDGDAISVNGTIDRVDILDSELDIVDYKTGKVGSLLFSLEESRSDEELTEDLGKYSQVLQLLFYYILAVDNGLVENGHSVRLGVYPFKGKDNRTKYLGPGRSKVYSLVRQEHYDEVISIIAHVFRMLFDPSRAFVQTEHLERCTYCPYADICGR